MVGLGEGFSARISPGFTFLQDVSDAPLQQVEIEPTSIADNLPKGFVDGGEVLADVSEQFLLLPRARYFMRFSHQISNHGILSPRGHQRFGLVFDKNKCPPSGTAFLFNRDDCRHSVGTDIFAIAQWHEDSTLDAHRKVFERPQRLGCVQCAFEKCANDRVGSCFRPRQPLSPVG